VSFVMPSADFGVVLPRMSLLATIGFAYSVISPIINGLATLVSQFFNYDAPSRIYNNDYSRSSFSSLRGSSVRCLCYPVVPEVTKLIACT
jgi:hypothetical protein